ncbi:tRNA pseudouridine(38-40) synthase TruA [Defluviitalea phaphyphila]|uniref:tRNA pseudouridine(38-40) synthase TruA n=1 Tax=Defluviitalea phaphyphila TaxID=1473580 RepID=UPI0007304EBE|nr:tRNA pseudouridine(38-40) synthase TruA [Defluviitalea phaphyphila]
MKNILLTISYDGTNYNGWQRQPNGIGIQQKIEEACKKIFKQDITVIGASRTDRGVHALGQRALIKVDTTIPLDRIPYALNSALPEDIIINNAEEVEENFHPRYSVKQKIYQYKILNKKFKIPQYRNISVHIPKKLDLNLMNKGAKYFIGTHDFISFCSTGSSVKTTIRTIYDAKVLKKDSFIIFEVKGNGFLYNMVRIMAGTLIEIGMGKKEPSDIEKIILSKDRNLAGKTAPPQGLTLVEILY